MSSAFISETELANIKKLKQEEWEKVRKAEDPLERPEEPYSNKSLYERLQEQKQKKDLEYEEAHKLKNMIKGLDDDEIEFLDLIDRTKLEADKKKELEDEIELKDYRNRVAVLQEKSIEHKLQAEVIINKNKIFTPNGSYQQKCLKGFVIKKNEAKKRKLSDRNENDDESVEISAKSKARDSCAEGSQATIKNNDSESNSNTGLKCVAILPGIGCYEDTSSDENSSDSEVDNKQRKIDWLGRKIQHHKEPSS